MQWGNVNVLETLRRNCDNRWQTACVVNIRTNALNTTLAADHTPNSLANRAAVAINGIRHPATTLMKPRSQHQFTLLQASENNPGLAKLMGQHKESSARLKAIQMLIPAPLRPFVKNGPFEDGAWCLMLSNNTTAAKLRQLLPTFEEKLRATGLEVKSIRLKVSRQS